jgi:MFS family permease
MNDKQKSLKFSIIEGAFASAMTGFTQDYFTPFLLVLGGTVQQIGLLSALPNVAASIMQINSARIVERLGSRKKMVIIFVLLQALSLIPIIILAFCGITRPLLFIFCAIFFVCFGAVATPAWGSLMSDLVDPNLRGAYFGSRSRILGFIAVLSTFIAGLILHMIKSIDLFKAFASLFIIAFLWRIMSLYFLRKMHDIPQHYSPENAFSLVQFLRRLKESNFAKFVVFAACMSFSVNIASPFFAVFMLKDLKFDYLLYTIVTLSASLTIHSLIARWGRHADRTGNLKVITITAPFIGFIPLLWLVCQHPIYLIFAQILSGFVWAGFNLCTTNFIYDAVTPQKRTRCIAYFNALNGTAVCLGAITGGYILPHLAPLFGYKVLTLFAISSFLRIAIGLVLPRSLKEVREVEKINSDTLFFSMIGIRPLIGVDRKTIRF